MSGRDADVARLSLGKALEAVVTAEEELGCLDAVAGDGDHGTGMVRGFRAAIQAVDDEGRSASHVLMLAGAAFADAAGGASGALYGAWIKALGESLRDKGCCCQAVAVHSALQAALNSVSTLGKARAGDKTMVDTLEPFTRAFGILAHTGTTLPQAWQGALEEAERGADSTTSMLSKKGRASRLAQRSKGHRDPGAVSALYVLRAVGEALSEVGTERRVDEPSA